MRFDSEEGDDRPKRYRRGRRFGVEIEVESIPTERAKRELRLPTG